MASERLIRQASYRGTRRYSDVRRREEVLPLLDDDDDHTDDPEDPSPPQPAKGPRAPNEFSDLPVFQNIWRIRREIVSNISDPYTLEQLRAPRLNTSVVRPLMEELYGLKDISIIYALLVNRYQFIRDQSYQAHYLSVNTARASLCELLAIKILRQYDEDSHGQNGLLLLANILIAGFEPFQNCPVEVSGHQPRKNKWPFSVDRGGFERHTTALEMAIISESKLFLSSPASQKVVDAIFIGRIMYTPTTFMDIIPDTYKRRSITLYNPEKHSLLNQYRLNVPRTRNVLEVSQFVLLLALFFLVQSTRDPVRFTVEEGIFCVYVCTANHIPVYLENRFCLLHVLGIHSAGSLIKLPQSSSTVGRSTVKTSGRFWMSCLPLFTSATSFSACTGFTPTTSKPVNQRLIFSLSAPLSSSPDSPLICSPKIFSLFLCAK